MGKKSQRASRQIKRAERIAARQKPQVKQGRGVWGWFGLAFFSLAAAVGYVNYRKQETATDSRPRPSPNSHVINPALQHVHALIDESERRHREDDYWLTGQEESGVFVDKARAWRTQLLAVIGRYAHAHPYAETVVKTIKGFRIDRREANGRCAVFAFENMIFTEEVGVQMFSKLGVCVTGSAYSRAHPQEEVFWYSNNTGAGELYAHAIELPEGVLAAIVLHELGHAHKHRVEQAVSATIHRSDDRWVTEEVEMHELEDAVLNAWSDGALGDLYKEIFSRPISTKESLIQSVTQADLLACEKALKVEGVGRRAWRVLASQFFVGLGLRWIDRTSPLGQRQKEKVAFYRWFTGIR